MLAIISRAACFILFIVLGYFLKRIGFFHEKDFSVLSKVVIRITLPAAIIVNFNGKEIDPSLFSLILLGLGGGILYMILGYLINLKKSNADKAFGLLNLSSYNIGCFTMPFAQCFLGPMGVITTSLFDTGNAVVCLGGSYGIASTVKNGKGFDVKRVAKALATSVPFITYVIMVLLCVLHISLPAPAMEGIGMIADANAFMAMFMIGVGFRMPNDKTQIGMITKMLSIRYAIAAALALIFYFLLPFAVEIRQALVILAFAPIGSAIPAFTGELDGDVGLSSALNSMSIVISIVCIVSLLSVML